MRTPPLATRDLARLAPHALALALCTAPTLAAHAQTSTNERRTQSLTETAPSQNRSPQTTQASAPAMPAHFQTIDLKFPGGTIAEYVGYVRRATDGEPINILLDATVAQERMPPVELYQVSLETAFGILQSTVNAGKQTEEWSLHVIDLTSRRDRAPTFRLNRAIERPLFQSSTSPSAAMELYNLSELLIHPEIASSDVLLSAIETGLGYSDPDGTQPPELLLHEDSQILFVRATRSQHTLVSAVIDQFSETIVVRARRIKELRELLYAAEGDRIDIEHLERTAQAERRYAENRLAMQADRHERGLSPREALMEAEHQHDMAKMNHERALSELERVHDRTADLEEQIESLLSGDHEDEHDEEDDD